MKGDPGVVRHLNAVLVNELTAINQYFLHARMFRHWGYEALGKHEYEESIDEMKHADRVIERILFLEGVPNLQRLNKLRVGETVKEQLESDLALEHAGIKFLNDGIALARQHGDNGSEELLSDILVDEESHTDWLETQLELIRQLGEPHYLAQQMRE